MKYVGSIVAMHDESGIGDVEVEGTNNRTTIFAADCKAAGINPKVGTRLIYSIGQRPPNGPTSAIALEKLS